MVRARKNIAGRRQRGGGTTEREDDIQRAVFRHLAVLGQPDAFAFHVPNGGGRSKVEGAIFKGLGVVAGVPDVVLVRAGQVYCLELKTSKGRLSDVQKRVHERLLTAGARVEIAYGLDAALQQLRDWDLLRETAHASAYAKAREDIAEEERAEEVSAEEDAEEVSF